MHVERGADGCLKQLKLEKPLPVEFNHRFLRSRGLGDGLFVNHGEKSKQPLLVLLRGTRPAGQCLRILVLAGFGPYDSEGGDLPGARQSREKVQPLHEAADVGGQLELGPWLPEVEDFAFVLVISAISKGDVLVRRLEKVLLFLRGRGIYFAGLRLQLGHVPVLLGISFQVVEELSHECGVRCEGRRATLGRRIPPAREAEHPAKRQRMEGLIPLPQRNLFYLAEPSHEQPHGSAIILLAKERVDDARECLRRAEAGQVLLPER